MSQTMKLSAEEISIIEQKRAEEQANKLALLGSYEHHKERTTKYQQERCLKDEKNSEDIKALYESYLEELLKVSPDYKLECKRNDVVVNHEVYDIDENGSEIRWTKDSEGETEWFKPRDIVHIKSYNYTLKLYYTGKVPEAHQYNIIPVEQYSKYGSKKGYKMKVRGTGIDSYDKRGLMTNATSVHKKIIDTIESAYRQIEYKNSAEQQYARIENRFKLEYSKYQNNYSVTANSFKIKLDNGITLTCHGYENGLGEIQFSSPKVEIPYGKFEVIDLIDLLEGLNNVKGKE
jgi:hypothetical protein